LSFIFELEAVQLIVFPKASLVSGVLFSFTEGMLGVFASCRA
jgi:hypothetical protein